MALGSAVCHLECSSTRGCDDARPKAVSITRDGELKVWDLGRTRRVRFLLKRERERDDDDDDAMVLVKKSCDASGVSLRV